MSTLEELDVRLARIEERVENMRTSIGVAKEEVDRRLGEMNQLRRQIESERGHYIEADRYEERHEALQQRIGTLENRVSAMEGGAQIKSSTIAWGLTGLGIFVTIVVVVVNLLTSGSP